MGLVVSKIKFDEDIPSFEKIRKQFEKQTGLELFIRAIVSLNEIPQNSRTAIQMLLTDVDDYESYTDKNIKENWDGRAEKIREINHIYEFQFWCLELDGMPFMVEKKVIELNYGVRSFYFPKSIEKCLIDLGGKFVDYFDETEIEFDCSKEWKKLKPWNSYNFLNRPRK